MQLNRLPIILASACLKRIKNKNFKLFKGRLIIEYLKIALQSRLFDKILVSTDNLKKIKFLKQIAEA